MIYLGTSREEYSVNDSGHIGRPKINLSPSGNWKLLGIERRNNFGRVVEYIPFEHIPAHCGKGTPMSFFRHKNGKGKWRVRDLDHGTVRVWGQTLTYVVVE